MTARWLTTDGASVRPEDLRPAIDWLRAGGIVAFPTDTLYGLAVDPMSETAVRSLFDLKGRSARAALPLIAGSMRQIEAACGPVNDAGRRLAAAWWPGPLSLVLDAPAAMPVAVHGGGRTIAVRVPASAVARALADAWGGMLTATSANPTGGAPVSSASDLAPIAHDARVFVVDAGRTPGGAPSTIVDARGATIALVRDGAVPFLRVLESGRA